MFSLRISRAFHYVFLRYSLVILFPAFFTGTRVPALANCLQIFFHLSRGRANAYFLALSNCFMLSRAFSTIASFRPCRLMQWRLAFCVMTVYHVIRWLSVMSQLSIWYAKNVTTRIEFWLAFIVFASSPCLLTDLRNIRHSNRGPLWTEHN